MHLPVNPPVLPMLAKRVGELPVGGKWLFEPKWDGFRALVFRDGDEILIQSRDEKSLNRYFPELLEPLRSQLPARCVVAGFRWHKKGERTAVGSLLLGLFDDSGALQHVGVCASFTDKKRRELVEFLAPYRKNALAAHPWKDWAEDAPASGEAERRMPGGQSRWSQGKDLSWEPLRPELVVEVAYDHMQAGRFRHTAQFRRWRTDKKPTDCTYAQLEVVPPQELKEI